MGISLNSADNTPVQATIREFQALSSSRFLSEILILVAAFFFCFLNYFNGVKWILIDQEELLISRRFIIMC